jgi:hypothetical protein
MTMKTPLVTLALLAVLAGATASIPASVSAGPTEDVQAAMQSLKTKAAALGAPSVKGEDTVAGKTVPVLYFGQTKVNGDFSLVDSVQKEVGGTETLFVKSGGEFVRVSTNVKKDDGSRAVGTVLDPKGKAIAAIAKGDAYFGEADILGKPYTTGYEPIRDTSNSVIGVYYVGFPKK